jgi:hypothetical protein
MVTMQGGVFGCVSTSDDVIAATDPPTAPPTTPNGLKAV